MVLVRELWANWVILVSSKHEWVANWLQKVINLIQDADPWAWFDLVNNLVFFMNFGMQIQVDNVAEANIFTMDKAEAEVVETRAFWHFDAYLNRNQIVLFSAELRWVYDCIFDTLTADLFKFHIIWPCNLTRILKGPCSSELCLRFLNTILRLLDAYCLVSRWLKHFLQIASNASEVWNATTTYTSTVENGWWFIFSFPGDFRPIFIQTLECALRWKGLASTRNWLHRFEVLGIRPNSLRRAGQVAFSWFVDDSVHLASPIGRDCRLGVPFILWALVNGIYMWNDLAPFHDPILWHHLQSTRRGQDHFIFNASIFLIIWESFTEL